jgi:ketosteroid isomerase-like protein
MRTAMLIAVLACAGAPGVWAQGDASSGAESKIIAMEHMWAQAYVSKDPRALASILDDGFICVASDGRVLNKAQVLEDVKTTSSAVQILTEAMVVHLHGDTAIVTGTFRTKGMKRGKPYERRERFVDTWIYRDGQWISLTTMVGFAAD